MDGLHEESEEIAELVYAIVGFPSASPRDCLINTTACFHSCWFTLPNIPSIKASHPPCFFRSSKRLSSNFVPSTQHITLSTKLVFSCPDHLLPSSVSTISTCRLYCKFSTYSCWYCMLCSISYQVCTSSSQWCSGKVSLVAWCMSTPLRRLPITCERKTESSHLVRRV